ncbi:hypothetical protein AUM99_09960 [Cronobacter sakazakii]|nr:hypothetical protein AUM99_09960 [Cronobacter sakazakii]
MCSSRRRARLFNSGETTHEQFNNTLPQVATYCAAGTGRSRSGAVPVCSEIIRPLCARQLPARSADGRGV